MTTRAAIEGTFVATCTLALLLTEIDALGDAGRVAVAEEARDSLAVMAKLVAATIDVREHESFVNPEQVNDPAFIAAEARITRLRQSDPRFVYIYTVRAAPDDRYWFVLDPQLPPTPDGFVDDDVMLMRPYEHDMPRELRKAAERRIATATDEPYEDKWGTFMSGYAPIFDPDSGLSVGVAAVDIDAAEWEHKFDKLTQEVRTAKLLAFTLSAVFGLVVFAARCASDSIARNLRQLGGKT